MRKQVAHISKLICELRQAGLSNGANCGIIIGGFLNGWLSQRFGYKRVCLGALFFMNWFIFILFFAHSAQVLLVGQILCGLMYVTSLPIGLGGNILISYSVGGGYSPPVGQRTPPKSAP